VSEKPETTNSTIQKAGNAAGETESRPSRRGLFASIGAGAATAALVNPGKIFAATTPPIPSIRIAKDITDSLAESTRIGSFDAKGGMTGAEVLRNPVRMKISPRCSAVRVITRSSMRFRRRGFRRLADARKAP
jgi:hypothetical protein